MPPKSKGPQLVQLRPGGNFYIRWADGHGANPRRSTGTSDRALAEAVLKQTLADPGREEADGPTISDCLALYKRDTVSKLGSKETPTLAIIELSEFLGHLPAEGLAKGDVAGFYAKPGRKTLKVLAPSSRARQLTVLRAALNHARKEGIIKTVPIIHVAPPAQPRDRFLTKPEARRLLAAAKDQPHVELFIELALATAARPGALLDLTWDRVDLKKRRIDLQPLSRARTSKRRPVVPIPPELARRLAKRRITAKTGHVIEYRKKPLRSIKRAFRHVVAEAGLKDVIPYTLRHTAATWMAEAGVPIAMIAQMLGQTIHRTTERYIKHHPDYLRDAMEALRLRRKK
jgi:integrase